MDAVIVPQARPATRFAGEKRGSPAKLPQIPALTGLRFFAAFFILFAHATDWIAQFQDSEIRQKVTFVAMYGMPLFFVLSGFVIHYNYANLFTSRSAIRATCEFAAARFARLFPLYFVLLLMAVFADDFVAKTYNRPDLFFEIFGYYVTLTQSWWYVVYEQKLVLHWLFGVSWSISTEMYFYASYVAVIFIILRLRGARAAVISALGFALSIALVLGASRYGLDTLLTVARQHIPGYLDVTPSSESSFYRWLFYYSPYVRVFEFLLGCLTAQAVILLRDRKRSPYEERAASAVLAASLASLVLWGALYLGVGGLVTVNLYVQHFALNFLCAPSIAFILFYVARYNTAFTKLLSLPILVGLGDTSYSIYLVHTWTLRIFTRPAPSLNWVWGLDTLFRIFFGILFTLVAAYATYQLIETPSRKWLRDRLGRIIAGGFESKSLVVGPRRRFTFAFGAIVVLFAVALVGQAARSDAVWARLHRLWYGDRPEIEVVSASYGLNCKTFPVPAPFSNHVEQGNATKPLAYACNSHQHCDFLIDTSRIGDPANGCGKDFKVQYRCTGSDELKSEFLPAEAEGKRMNLDCGAAK
jgi:hypothetical protein